MPSALLIAAWAHNAESPAALLARRLLGDQDWARHESAVFPTAVLTLFATDVATAAPAAPPTPLSFAARPALHRATTNVCEQFQGFVNNVIDGVLTAIGHLGPWIGSWAAPALKWLFERLGDAVANLPGVAQVVQAVRSVAAVVAVASEIVLALRPWTAEIVPDPTVAHRGVAAQKGRFELIVRTVGPDRWPPVVESCANLFKVTLPNLKPSDADVAWNIEYQFPEPMITKTGEDGRLNTEGRAELRFETLVEPPDVAAGKEETGTVHVAAAVHRKDLDGVRDRLITGLWESLPLPRVLVDEARKQLQPYIDKALKPLTELKDTAASGTMITVFHRKDDDSPTTAPTTTAPKNALMVRRDFDYGAYVELVSCDGPYGTWSGVFAPPKPGELPIDWGPASVRFTLTGPNKPTRIEFMFVGAEDLGPNVIDVTTDGTTMTWTEIDSPDRRRGGGGYSPVFQFPITPAPAGRC